MMNKKKPLFAFDLRIQKQIAKLCVYQDDFLQDIIERFSKLAKLGQNFHNKIKDKLQNQLRKLLTKQNCSQIIRDKIESFLEESKIVIVAVTQTQNYEPSNRTSYPTPKEPLFPSQRAQPNKLKQILFQSQKISPHLVKYASKQILVQQQNQSSIQQLLQRYTQRQNLNQLLDTKNRQDRQRQPQGNYKWKREDQITLETIRNNRIARSQQRQKRSLLESYHQQTQNQYKNNHSVSHFNKERQQQLASYHNYKENCKKKSITNQASVQLPRKLQPNSSRQCLKRVYPENTYNLSELKRTYCENNSLVPSKSLKSFKYDNSNEFRTKFDYDKCMQAKGVSGCFKQNKKFTYLGQAS